MADLFDSIASSATSTVNGVVNRSVNQTVGGVVNAGVGVVDSTTQAVAGTIGSTATGMFGETVGGVVGDIAGGIASGVTGALSNAIYESDFMSSVRSFSLFGGGSTGSYTEGTWFSNGEIDWRVRLAIPPFAPYNSSSIFDPLKETNDSLVFPYTPTVMINNSANYNQLAPVHNIYTYPAYQNSSVESITISGEFSAENPIEARYWVAANHFLRSVTKMAYGDSDNQGIPPPVLRLHGYGDFVFKNVPVVIESFTMELPKDVDYIKSDFGPNGSWVPALSTISITLKVAFSRDEVNSFSLDKFVNGSYLNSSVQPGYI